MTTIKTCLIAATALIAPTATFAAPVIGLTGDTVTSTHPVVRGVAVVDA